MVQSREAARVLEDVERLARQARVDLRHLDVPLIVFGVLMLASPAFASGSGVGLRRYWLVAAPAGILLSARLSLRHGRKTGIVRSTYAGLAVSFVIVVAAFAAASAASVTSSPIAAAVCPVLALGTVYLMLALLGRTLLLAATGTGLLALGLVVWADGATGPGAAVMLALAGGATLLATGVGYWFAGRSTR